MAFDSEMLETVRFDSHLLHLKVSLDLKVPVGPQEVVASKGKRAFLVLPANQASPDRRGILELQEFL